MSTQTKAPGPDRDESFWSGVAPRYAKSKIGDPGGYERTLERTRSLLSDGDTVLELGCGTGLTALRLAPSADRYLATDLAPGMIEQASERLAAEPNPKLEFRVATAQNFASEAGFDVVLGFNYLHLVENLAETLKSIHGLVKPGGLFISKTPCLGDMNPVFRVVVPLFRLFGKAPDNLLFFTRQDLLAALRSAGFEVEAVEHHRSKKPERDKRPFIVARRR